MRKFLLFLFAVCYLQTGIGQNNKNQEVDIVSHTVELGETVRMISRKYLVSPTEIYKLNKFAVDGVSQGQVLQIPVPRKESVFQQEETPSENTSESEQAEIKNDEPIAEKPITVKKVKSEKQNSVTVIDHNSQTDHTVLAGETLFSLSRMYNISVDEIKLSNGNGLKKGLKVGQIVKIPGTKTLGENESSLGSDVTPSAEVNFAQSKSVTNETIVSDETETISHKVVAKETLYSLSKKYKVTVEDIKSQNPELANHGLQVGEILKIRINK